MTILEAVGRDKESFEAHYKDLQLRRESECKGAMSNTEVMLREAVRDMEILFCFIDILHKQLVGLKK